MDKINVCDGFAKKLSQFRINFKRCSHYHIQIQVQHNFYPSTGVYYNSESGERFKYKNFESAKDVLTFLSEHVK